MTARRGAKSLEVLLNEQRAALRSGRLEVLAALVPRFERAIETLDPGGRPEDLTRLRALARENATLLAAAQEGVARAQRQLRAASSGSLSTYDASGRKSADPQPEGRLLARR